MFELLRFVRVQQVNRTTPVVCLLEAREGFAPVALDGMDQGSKALAANAFMDLEKYPDDDRGNGRLRRIIDLLIDIDGELHAGFDAVDDQPLAPRNASHEP
jgi:hypothetical protein